MKPQISAFRLKTIKKLNILIFIFSITQILLIFYVSIVTPYLYSWDAVQGILLFFSSSQIVKDLEKIWKKPKQKEGIEKCVFF